MSYVKGCTHPYCGIYRPILYLLNILDISSAVCIGMLPKIPLDYFRQAGNAAGLGAKAVLVSKTRKVREIRYVELAGYPCFQRIFMKAVALV